MLRPLLPKPRGNWSRFLKQRVSPDRRAVVILFLLLLRSPLVGSVLAR